MRAFQVARLLSLSAIVLFFGCQNAADQVKTEKTKPNEQAETLKEQTAPQPKTSLSGEVNASVKIKGAAGESYALFIPRSLVVDSVHPILIFLDPHGNGDFPLNKYSQLAEKYGFILMGSNNSKNGLSFQQTVNYVQNLVTEAQQKFNPAQVYLCGFSGGAKVALMAATRIPDIKTVIYCGAVTPIEPTINMVLFGFAGTEDMNYTDVVAFHRELKGDGLKKYLIEWDGPHEFPRPEVIEEAFQFLVSGEVENYNAKSVTISAKEVQQEQRIKQEYMMAFRNKDLNWWQQTTDHLKAQPDSDKMSKRLLGFISLACYSLTQQALQQNNQAVAQRIVGIYKMADPDNEAIGEFEKQLN